MSKVTDVNLLNRLRPGVIAATAFLLAIFATLSGATVAQAAEETEFIDVPAYAKFYTEISWLADQRVTTGYSDGTFHPTESVSREAIAAFLYRGDTILDRDGTYTVGTTVKPGTYTAVVAGGPYGLDACYWERRDRDGDDFDGTLANELTFNGRTIVTILTSDKYFQIDGCSGLTPLRKTSPTATAVGDGTHAVGFHMMPGTYAAYGATGDDSCYWAKLSGFTGDFDEILDNEYIDGRPARVTLTSGQGFDSRGCGTWRRISG